MLTLIDTAIGFIAVLLMISLVIKGITSIIKDFVDYKRTLVSRQLQKALPRLDEQIDGWRDAFEGLVREGKVSVTAQDPRLVRGLTKALTTGQAAGERKPEAATEDKAKALAARPSLGADYLLPAIQALDERVEAVVTTTNKNLSLAIGLCICLLFNINCLNVWRTLYHDANLRGQMAATATTLSAGTDPAAGEAVKKLAEAQSKALGEIDKLRTDVPFAFGKIWQTGAGKANGSADNDWRMLLYEFFGSLLTGVLASIGAPYLHDMLCMLTALRKNAETWSKKRKDRAGSPA